MGQSFNHIIIDHSNGSWNPFLSILCYATNVATRKPDYLSLERLPLSPKENREENKMKNDAK